MTVTIHSIMMMMLLVVLVLVLLVLLVLVTITKLKHTKALQCRTSFTMMLAEQRGGKGEALFSCVEEKVWIICVHPPTLCLWSP